MLTIYHIATKVVPLVGGPAATNGAPTETTIVPALDERGHEVVLWKVEVPAPVEAEGVDAIEAYVAAATAHPVGEVVS